ncbi:MULTISPECIES: HlyD family secretion protein [unclassified Pseudomonas]|uniref:HlyD family secretion protein n=2 Tax=Pseudomonas TaxID=286 RepID=UPI00385AA98E
MAALVGAAVWGAHWWSVGRFIESTNDAYLQADSLSVSAKISGTVSEVYVTDNQTVSVGQPLVRLDVRPYQAAREKSEAAIRAAQADIARGEAELEQHTASIAQVQAQLDGEIANEQYAAAQVKRYAPLAQSGAETQERMAELRNALRQASAQRAAQAAALNVAQRQLHTQRAAIEQARAQLASAQASTRQSTLDEQDTVVYSTLDGRVGSRSVRVGQYLQPGTRLMTIVPINEVYLTANFKETQIERMHPGQTVAVHIDAWPGVEFEGVIESLSPGTGSQFALLPSNNATGNFTKIVQRVPVRIRLHASPDASIEWMPGLSATADVDTRRG